MRISYVEVGPGGAGLMKSGAGGFETRRGAGLAVEGLVQEYGVERTDIVGAPEGRENSAGQAVDGADLVSGLPGSDERDDSALGAPLSVSIDIDDENAELVRNALTAAGAGHAQIK